MATQNHTLDSTSLTNVPGGHIKGKRDLAANPRPKVPGSKSKSTNEDANTSARPESGDNSITPIDFAEIKDGTLIELVEDPVNLGQKCLAVWKAGEIRFLDRLEQDGRVFVPLARDNKILRSIRLPKGAESYGSVLDLITRLESLISQCIALDEEYVPVLANFVLSTWFVDRFLVAPYLSVVGLPQSGKTTLLRLLSLVCRRSLLVADISTASFYWACARFMATILIDETGTVGNNRALRHMLRSGTTRDVLAVRTDADLHSYGAKVVSWLEPPDDPALNSRCILIPMFECKSSTLLEIGDPKIQQLAQHLRAQLLRFRLDNFKNVKPVPVPGDEVLRPRARDLLRALTAATAQDAQRSQTLRHFFETGQVLPSEPLSTEQTVVLQFLFSLVHAGESYSSIWVAEVTSNVNSFLKLAGERLRLEPRRVGSVLTSMGFTNRKRTNRGWTLQLSMQDSERIHQLVARYGIDGFEDFILNLDAETCNLCKATGLNKEGPDAPSEATATEHTIYPLKAIRGKQ